MAPAERAPGHGRGTRETTVSKALYSVHRGANFKNLSGESTPGHAASPAGGQGRRSAGTRRLLLNHMMKNTYRLRTSEMVPSRLFPLSAGEIRNIMQMFSK